MGRETFCAFVDFQKAFDWVDKELLMYQLLSYNINGLFHKAIKELYSNMQADISINDMFTSSFVTMNGVSKEIIYHQHYLISS